MDNNTGSFGSAIGGSAALKASMAQRGMDASILDQVSPGSVAGPSPVPAQPQQSPQAGVTAPTPAKEPDSDMKIALKALAGVVKNEGDLKKTVVQMKAGGMV